MTKLRRMKRISPMYQRQQPTGIGSPRFMFLVFIMAGMTGYTASITHDWTDMQQINIYFDQHPLLANLLTGIFISMAGALVSIATAPKRG